MQKTPPPPPPPPQAQMLNITTEQIQKCLDENKQLIMAILENQNMGKFAECASYQAQLQQNLMYLARIADAQPQGTQMPFQSTPQSAMQQDHYMQPSQVAMSQQPLYFTPKLPFQLTDQQQQHLLAQGQMRMRPSNNGGTDP